MNTNSFTLLLKSYLSARLASGKDAIAKALLQMEEHALAVLNARQQQREMEETMMKFLSRTEEE